MGLRGFVDSVRKCLHRKRSRRASPAVWYQLKPLFVTTLRGRAQCAPRDVSGDHVLNKRESRRVVEEPLHASLVSYGAWPGDQGRFYSREAEPRVPASRRDAAAERRGDIVQGARVA